MDNLIAVLRFCSTLLNYRLRFTPFEFTILQALVGSFVFSIFITFLKKVFQ